MSHPISPATARLASRLRTLADELESAERYGVPAPYAVTLDGHEFGTASFHATPDLFDQWADYTEATVTDYERDGRFWRRAEALVNGLPLQFATVLLPVPAQPSAAERGAL